jgi:hypothetical protein
MVICINELTPQDQSFKVERCKFGRICQRFCFAHCCGSRRLQSELVCPGDAMRHAGLEFSAVRMKEHDA